MKKRGSSTVVISLGSLVSFFLLILYFSNSTLNSNIKFSTISQESMHMPEKSTGRENLRSVLPSLQSPKATQIECNRSHYSYDICKINSPTVLDPTTSTFYVMSPKSPSLEEKIRPYARKWEPFTMSRIKAITLTSGPLSPKCQVQHKAPALVFSAGGYTGNFFHDFNDGFIPLYITVNSIFNKQDPILVISEANNWWINKYAEILRGFSQHQIINLDNNNVTHCFPSVDVGLISHGFMTINPKSIPNAKTFTHFHAFLRKAYTRSHHVQIAKTSKSPASRPRLVLVCRTGATGRVLMNRDQVKEEAEKIGFDVVVFEPTAKTPLSVAYDLVSSSHVMVGVHGAGLTHALFLRPGSVLVQVVPLGAEWVAEVCFGNPARAARLEYMEYRIKAEESSLIEKYGKDEMVVKDPVAFRGNKWSAEVMHVYLKKQDIRVDLNRFSGYLKEAYKKSNKLLENGEKSSG
ncbi:hypothetical protein FEM48_Zijuj10G0091500 [Ziziphus jujuba var. spinosa]|uniref:Glycosyltransferase 61 catalytic domain-containing protein n=1 Tax=Ziziphus jujuba var. spinosa TaxID=714518 RepID=A0A978UMI0_ZIZJJ|nr:hypothetical protein FEM48_Zijuj10G0091500 [Ziziphus jujuba var. spinosa]